MIYNATFRCPICGNQEHKPVTASGDSDGDSMFQLRDCKKCEGIKAAAPSLWNRMDRMYREIIALRQRHEKEIEECRKGLIDPQKASGLLHQPFALGELFEEYRSEFRECMECGSKNTKTEKWAHHKACRRLIFAYLEKAKITL